MKKLLLLLTLLSSLSSFGQSWHSETVTFDDAMEYIQQNFSYHCGIEIKSKRKMFFNCTSDNAMTFVKVKLKPGEGSITDRVEKVTFEFLNSEDGQYTITDAYNNLVSKYSHVCGIDKLRTMRKGKSKFKFDCKVKKFGNLVVELKLNSANGVSDSVEEFKVTFTKEQD